MITVVGIGADGWAGLAEASRQAIEEADVLFGSSRQLALIPEPAAHPPGTPAHVAGTEAEASRPESGATERTASGAVERTASGAGAAQRASGAAERASEVEPSRSGAEAVDPAAGRAKEAVGRGAEAVGRVGVGGGRERVAWPSPLLPALPKLLEQHEGREICVLASGDPLFYGIGATLVRLVGPARVRILPHLSSLTLACARMGWPVESVDVVSLVGRPLAMLNAAMGHGRRVLVLGGEPLKVAELLVERGYGGSEMTVLSDLGAREETETRATAASLTRDGFTDLHVIAISCVAGPGAVRLPRVPGLPDDAYEHDGQLTKRDVRAVTLARLAPQPGELLWDVGAGAGSIAIEWMRSHPSCTAVAIESDEIRAARIRRNADTLGVPSLQVVEGRAPGALDGLPAPDAVFVGGGLTAPGLLEACWSAVRPGGRLVANAVTLESEALVAQWYGRLGGELVRLAVQQASPLGAFTGWRPAMPVTVWSVGKDLT